MAEFLDWLARATGVAAVLLALIGYMFREKWKQILQRSLSSDLERLKAELSRENAVHAASLLPQFEQIKHDFQQKLEAYKVGLIAQAEAAKAQSELRKSIALRFSEIEFERLVNLELLVAPIGTDIGAIGDIDPQYKTLEQRTKALADIRALGIATEQAEMFLSLEDRMELTVFRRALLDFTVAHVGIGNPAPGANDELREKIITLASSTHTKLKARIRGLGTFPVPAP
ncbi:conserved hypothetical protein [Rubrivivax sp. A210]|uniref:hypothetical protein n=1 Tax=Rubrivivax sp. A210 TaxID=2772301 RepID=UPI00191AB8FC|nr:hypothetical protein [Rubrivivax sp. A210]CAD5374852.1 conserved hypothetical protein [Rubrivivax sp. A210]